MTVYEVRPSLVEDLLIVIYHHLQCPHPLPRRYPRVLYIEVVVVKCAECLVKEAKKSEMVPCLCTLNRLYLWHRASINLIFVPPVRPVCLSVCLPVSTSLCFPFLSRCVCFSPNVRQTPKRTPFHRKNAVVARGSAACATK